MTNNAKIQYDILKAWVASWNVHTKRKLRKTKIHESWVFLYNFSQVELTSCGVVALKFGSSRK